MKQEAHFTTLSNCPSCEGTVFTPHLSAIDHTYSKLEFQLVKCSGCNLVFTNPRPVEEENANYYKSADYISHTNSTKGLIGILYKWVRNINLKRKVRVLVKHKSGKDVLDIGCGTGYFPAAANAAGYHCVGVEPDPDALKFALENNKIEAYPLEKLTIFNRQFNTVTMWHVLEHVYHLREQLQTIKGLIRPGGLFVIALPNYKSYDGTLYKEAWAGYDVPRHLYHFEEKTVESLMNAFGFELADIIPMKFDAYYVSMLSEKHRKGSMLTAFLHGRKSNAMARNKKHPWSSQIYVFKNTQVKLEN
ncbi:MAG TPA: class I SAM-dependent methyltransferase [Flavobacteriales bacterium]|nr:class I SAM-dependent methyltransferase [Flavobacteriales bacterium]